MPSITTIPAPRVPPIDKDGRLTREWYRFFYNLFELTGGGGSSTTTVDILLEPQLDVSVVTTTLESRISALEMAPAYSPPGEKAHAATVEHDFGNRPVHDAVFAIVDPKISPTSKVLVTPGGAAIGRTADDWQWDGATIGVVPGSGSATCYVTFHPGPIVGPRAFNYMVI